MNKSKYKLVAVMIWCARIKPYLVRNAVYCHHPIQVRSCASYGLKLTNHQINPFYRAETEYLPKFAPNLNFPKENAQLQNDRHSKTPNTGKYSANFNHRLFNRSACMNAFVLLRCVCRSAIRRLYKRSNSKL